MDRGPDESLLIWDSGKEWPYHVLVEAGEIGSWSDVSPAFDSFQKCMGLPVALKHL